MHHYSSSPHHLTLSFFYLIQCPRTVGARGKEDSRQETVTTSLNRSLCQNPRGPDGVDCVFTSSDKIGPNGDYSPWREVHPIPCAWEWAEEEAFARIV